MDIILNDQLDRVEQLMIQLIDSITTNNPSTEVLSKLLAADDNLSRGLSLLATHQRNHQRILELRRQIDEENRTYTLLSRLVDGARQEVLKAKPSLETTAAIDVGSIESKTGGPSSQAGLPQSAGQKGSSTTIPAPIKLDELLRFAKGISKFSVPPAAYSEIFPSHDKGVPPTGVSAASDGAPPTKSPGSAAPPTTATPMTATASFDAPLSAAADGGPDGTATSTAVDSLTHEQKAWLSQMLQSEFFPWPSADNIKNGAVAKVRNWSADDFVRKTYSDRRPDDALQDQDQSTESTASDTGNTQSVDSTGPTGGAANEQAGYEGAAYNPPANPVADFEGADFDLYDPDM